jgi:hypothetical protein
MIPLALLSRCCKPIGFRASLDPTVFFEHRVDFGNAGRALRMIPRIVFFKDWAVVQKHSKNPCV